MKQRLAKRSSSKNSLLNGFKRVFLRSKKSAIMSIVAVLVLASLVSYGAYLRVDSTNKANAELKRETDNKQAYKKQVENPQVSTEPIAKTPNTTDEAEAAKPAVNNGGVMSKKGCYAGCATANPSFSIVMDNVVTVTAGTRTGVYKTATSNGYTVDWTTPYNTNGGHGPLVWNTASSTLHGPTSEFYVEAAQDVAPGNYPMLIRATHGPSETVLQKVFTVTVTALAANNSGQTTSP